MEWLSGALIAGLAWHEFIIRKWMKEQFDFTERLAQMVDRHTRELEGMRVAPQGTSPDPSQEPGSVSPSRDYTPIEQTPQPENDSSLDR